MYTYVSICVQVLWYTHSIGFPKLTAAWAHGMYDLMLDLIHILMIALLRTGLKLMWNDYEGRTGKKLPPSFRLFDMYVDPKEEHDLLPSLLSQACLFLFDIHT